MSKITTRGQRIQALHEDFVRATVEAFNTATAMPEGAGISDEWRALCTKYGVELLSEPEREQIRLLQKPLRGAAVSEFGQVIDALMYQTRHQLRHVSVQFTNETDDRLYERLERLLARSEKELLQAYKQAVLPVPKGLFANVRVHHQPQASLQPERESHVMRCQSCGAPRLRDQDMQCAFCDQPLFSPP